MSGVLRLSFPAVLAGLLAALPGLAAAELDRSAVISTPAEKR